METVAAQVLENKRTVTHPQTEQKDKQIPITNGEINASIIAMLQVTVDL